MKSDYVNVFRLYCIVSSLVFLDLITSIMSEPYTIEINPFALWQWNLVGFANFVVIRLGAHFLVGFSILFAMYHFKNEEQKKEMLKWSTRGLIFLMVLFGVVVLNNFLVLLFVIS